MGGNSKVILGAVLVMGFCWFMLFGVSTNKNATVLSTANFGIFKSSRGAARHKGLVLNYVSKRRVPNGPDPIHNRRTRNTGQPPDRA